MISRKMIHAASVTHKDELIDDAITASRKGEEWRAERWKKDIIYSTRTGEMENARTYHLDDQLNQPKIFYSCL